MGLALETYLCGCHGLVRRRGSRRKLGWKAVVIWVRRYLTRHWHVLMAADDQRRIPIVDCRAGHVAVTAQDRIVVWGGYELDDQNQINYAHRKVAMYTVDLAQWRYRVTEGQIPPGTCGAAAVVSGHRMFVLAGFQQDIVLDELWITGNTNAIYALDLNTLLWSRISPKGVPPIASDKLTAWTFGKFIYVFGGFGECHTPPEGQVEIVLGGEAHVNRGWNNQFLRYDVDLNQWEWPNYKGHKPSPRAAHAAIVVGSSVFIFGGRLDNKRLNDLHHCDLNSLTWTCLMTASETPDPSRPQGRSWHSLTVVSETSAILYGGYDNLNTPLGDCWRLDLSEPKYRHTNKPRWTRLAFADRQPRLWHQAVLEPESRQLWLLGGVVKDILNQHESNRHPDKIDKLVIEASPLKYLAAVACSKHYERIKRDLEFIPKSLQTSVKSKAAIDVSHLEF